MTPPDQPPALKAGEAEARIIDDYEDDDNIAVAWAVLEALAVPTPPGHIDGDAGPVIRRTPKNIKALKAARLAPARDFIASLGGEG